MSIEHKPVSPLRQRMTEDMRLRKLAEKTQSGYIRWVKSFTRFLGRGELMAKMSHVRVPRKLPVVLSPEEVMRLLEAAPGLKYKAALAVAYGAGLRTSEVVALKVDDIDSERMVIRVEQGKGRKDRYVMLSPTLLALLRQGWCEAHVHGKMLPHGWLFPGQDPLDPMSTRQLNRACHTAAAEAGIAKRVSLHTLRHSLPICSSTRRTSVSSRCCSGTRSWRPPRSMPRWPPAPCARSPVPWSG